MNNPAASSGVSPDVSLPDKSGQAGILLKQNIRNPFIDSRQKISGMTKRGKPRGIKPIFENKPTLVKPGIFYRNKIIFFV